MAKKKEFHLEDSIKVFNDAMERAGINELKHLNGVCYCMTKKGYGLLVIPEKELWKNIVTNNNIKELDLNDKKDSLLINKLEYGKDLDSKSWIKIDSKKLYQGSMEKVNIEGYTYDVEFNKSIFPIRFRKAEFNNFAYRIQFNPIAFLIKKYFESPIPDTGFTILRAFNIL